MTSQYISFTRKLYLLKKLLEYKLARRRLKSSNHKVLIVNLDNMGDLILFSPVILVIKEKLQYHVTLLMAQKNLELSSMIPGVDSVLTYQRDYPPYYPTDEEMKYYLNHQNLFKKLKGVGFGVGISISTNEFNASLGNLLIDYLGCERRIALNKGLFPDRMTDLIEIDPALHWTENYLALVRPLGIHEKYIPPNLYLPPGKDRLGDCFQNGKPIIAIQPGGRDVYPVSKLWPVKNYIELSSILIEKGYNIAILGDEDDCELGRKIHFSLKRGERIVNLCGKMNLTEFAHFLSRIEGYVTNDTGPLHLAAAVGCRKVVAVFGPTSPERLLPRRAGCRFVRSYLPCAPCVGNDFPPKCQLNHQECLNTVSVRSVVQALLG